MKKSIQKKGRKTDRPPTTRPGAGSLPLGPGGHTNQQDRIQSIRGKTKIISLGEILKGEVLKGEVLKDKPQQRLTRPGRLRARSGSKLPAARFRSGPLKTVVCEGQGPWYCLRVLCWKCLKSRKKNNNLNFSWHFLKKYDFTYDFHWKIQKISKMTPWDPKSEKIARQGEQKWSQGHQKWAKGHQKWAKREPKGAKSDPNGTKRQTRGAKREPKGDQNASKSRCSEKVAKKEPNGGVQYL